jgi:hypothetical protein
MGIVPTIGGTGCMEPDSLGNAAKRVAPQTLVTVFKIAQF